MEPDITANVPRQTLDDIIASVDDQGFYLVALDGRDAGTWIALGDKPIVGGRDPNLDIVFTNVDVSRRHLMVSVLDGVVLVEDLESTNGTFIDGHRVLTRAPLHPGSILRVGAHALRCVRGTRRDMERSHRRQRDLQRAVHYVQSLLPPTLSDGPVRTEWLFLPSVRLGGDGFGYEQLDARTFALYLIDVAGHGVGAAMHSVSVLNVLRQHALPATDFKDPVQVLSALNTMFQMERHDDQYFTIWYGLYDLEERRLRYASAGHHPAFLVSADKAAVRPLKTSGPVVGAIPGARFACAETTVSAGSSLYLFSDGAFEIESCGRRWRLDDFVPLLLEPTPEDGNECGRLHRAVTTAAGSDALDDDFSMLRVTFTL